MIPVFIGWDSREEIAWHVLARSLIRRSSTPLALTPIGNAVLPEDLWYRPRGRLDSTEFSCARFLVPMLMGFEGWAIFMDCDMLAQADLAELWAQRDERYGLMCVPHRHLPTEETKFLGAPQTGYARKNWSSLMLFNCAHPACRSLTLEYVNRAEGLELHRFAWASDEAIGFLRGPWNALATGPERLEHPEGACPTDDVALLHLTRGGPWHGVRDCGWDLWCSELRGLLAGGNPGARAAQFDQHHRISVHVNFEEVRER